MDNYTHIIETSESDLFARKCATRLVLIVWDIAGSIGKEYNFVFRRPTMWIKWLYIFARTYGLVCQVANFIIVMGPLSNFPVSPRICYRWFYFQAVEYIVLIAIVEIILVLRIFALYGKNKVVGAILASAIVLEFGTNVTYTVLTVHKVRHDTACIVVGGTGVMTEVGCGACIIFTQSIIWGFALWKYKFGLPEGWASAPIVSLVIREGGLTYFAICAVSIFFIPFSLRVKDLTFILMSIQASGISVVACRLIMNMQQLRHSERFDSEQETKSTSLEFELTNVNLESGYAESIPPSNLPLNDLGSSIP